METTINELKPLFNFESGRMEILFESHSPGQKIFYGDPYRALSYMDGYYVQNDERMWPIKNRSWEHENIKTFIEQACENKDLLGVYLLWYIFKQDIVRPTIKTYKNCYDVVKTVKKETAEKYKNISVDYYSICITEWSTECKDKQLIKSELTKALEAFDLDKVFDQMVECYMTQDSKKIDTDLLNKFKENFLRNREGYPKITI